MKGKQNLILGTAFGLFLLYPFLHGLVPLWGGKAPIGALPFIGNISISNTGLSNFLYIGLLSSLLLLTLWNHREESSFSKRQLFVFLPLLFALARFTFISKQAFIYLENLMLLLIGIYFALRIPTIRSKLAWQRSQRWPWLIIGGFLLTSSLPFFVDFANAPAFDGYSIVIAGANRFQGWYGDPQVVGMLGYTALAWVLNTYEDSSRLRYFLVLIPIILLLNYFLSITAFRSAFAALIIMSLTLALVALIHKRYEKVIIAAIVISVAVGLQFRGALAKKNMFQVNAKPSVTTTIVKSNDIPEATTLSPNATPARIISSIPINTSGRGALYKEMFSKNFENKILGNGLGASERFIQGHELFSYMFGNDPHSDAVKIVFEQGILGLLVCIVVFIFASILIIKVNLAAAPIILGIAAFLVISNPLVHPVWFMGPNLLLLFSKLNETHDGKNS